MMKPPIPPFPPIDPEAVDKILKVVTTIGKKVWGILKDFFGDATERTSQDIGQTKAYKDEKAEINDVIELNRILSSFLNNVEEKAGKLEQSILVECSSYFAELIDFLNREEQFKKYKNQINRLERLFRKTTKMLEGTFKDKISKRISLSDFECNAILKMLPGERKTVSMKEFTEKVLTESIEMVINEIKIRLEEFCEETEDILVSAVEQTEAAYKTQLNALTEIEKSFQFNEEEVIKYREKSKETSDICDIGLSAII
ncbi:hypothetical protein V7103_21015 [Neobacillus drentensis]|jgi:hypothetical protein|uniref:hypothetical protein n=1 Tax=Neobacillus drentensis TaxID=220684 RepID=UPI003000CBCE